MTDQLYFGFEVFLLLLHYLSPREGACKPPSRESQNWVLQIVLTEMSAYGSIKSSEGKELLVT